MRQVKVGVSLYERYVSQHLVKTQVPKSKQCQPWEGSNPLGQRVQYHTHCSPCHRFGLLWHWKWLCNQSTFAYICWEIWGLWAVRRFTSIHLSVSRHFVERHESIHAWMKDDEQPDSTFLFAEAFCVSESRPKCLVLCWSCAVGSRQNEASELSGNRW